MSSFFSEEFPIKMAQEDDAASTASGASSDPVSPPTSPDVAEIKLTSSPASIASLSEAATPSWESLKDLPSVGSLGHFAGLCSRCCFHSKGRCQNGYDCRFCHFDHEKRQRKKKFNDRGYPVAPVHQPLENRGFHNEAWRSTCQLPQYVSAPPGLECNLHAPPPLHYPMVTVPSPAFSAAASQGKIVGAGLETSKAEASVEVPPLGTCDAEAASSAKHWPVDKVMDWLTSTGFGHISKNFEEHRITGDVLLDLDSCDLDEVGVRALGDKKRLLRAIAQLRTPVVQSPCPPPPPPPTPAPCWPAPLLETTSSWGFCPPPRYSSDATLI
eukprot:gnl/MRDRNA2_/MRDRNA2_102135_c0_seq1.p1 gnl/MRDRNA2_/MRDRNA2_102135_c0~~gnl/MRDRNA2_/MRDRNA2_102135_c0_seq1.p1  ORF type:complete len:327 (+),score=78.01 gnl/MRDRNA2_/MRDRNA2_102135_c0_seq1:92-1072(+)